MSYKTRCERCTDADLEEVTKFATGVFDVDFEHYLPFIYAKDSGKGHEHLVVREDGQIAAAVLNSPVTLRVGDVDILTHGVGTVCVREESRGRGYMSDMLAECLIESSEQGAVLSILSGQRQRYGYYGYALTGIFANHRFGESSVRHECGEGPSKYTVRKAEDSDAGTLDAIMRTAPIYPLRRAEDFVTILKHDYRAGYLVFDGDRAVGYFVVGDSENQISELVLVPGASVKDFLLAFREMRGDEFWIEGNVFDVELKRELTTLCSDWSYYGGASVAILDFPKMLNAYGGLGCGLGLIPDGEFTIGIESHPFFDEIGISREGVTHGTFGISVKDGKFRAEPTDKNPDIALPYLRAAEYLFTPAPLWYPDSPKGARAVLPIPFFYPSQDKV
ncbi:MAG: GNAT family N-acetyltransferase [Clostridia bacterium]|nr:GNAT family N-acetyltransferase [Clostridia bacterium]